ncbi:MAG TPA: radical SAM protein [Thermoplasmatales archaeon]|nr:radical SAM protein [Thermoplasmatales archaeon]
MMFDPIELSEKIEKIVCREEERKYYRFRATRFYGGIATADVVGCNLRCRFCWSGNSVWNPRKTGRFYSPQEVAEKLRTIAEDKGFIKMRISGGEPTIGKEHLISLLEKVPQNLLFILETNGILLGADRDYVKELSKFRNLHVRVSLKGCDEREFNLLTGAKGFEYQIKSLEYLKREKVSFNIALVSIKKDRSSFFKKLIEMGLGKIMIEEEQIKLYPSVRRRLDKTNLLHYFD